MDQLITMADDPDARVRIAAFHALACDRAKAPAIWRVVLVPSS